MKTERTIISRAGFTLIESMIAMFFLAFIVGEMGMVFVYASRNTNLSQRITRANQLADEAVEKSRNTAYNNLQLANGALAETCVLSGTVASCTSTIDGRFTRVRTVSPLPAGTALLASNQCDVDAVVSFTDARGTPQTIRVASVVTRY
jgi:prepilin-type N-terminal cleavage/methylation domain-containing protein